jgi:hypothetical protein
VTGSEVKWSEVVILGEMYVLSFTDSYVAVCSVQYVVCVCVCVIIIWLLFVIL